MLIIKACTVGSGIETTSTCHGYNYLTVSTVSSLYGAVVALDIVFTSESIKKHHQKVHKQENKNH